MWSVQSANGVEKTPNVTKIVQPEVTTEPIRPIEITTQKLYQPEPRSIDIEKYVSQEFHNKNNVYQLPASSDTEKFIRTDYDYLSTSQHSEINYHTELTTPKSIIFDQKYKEAVDSVDQKLEHIDDSQESSQSAEHDIDDMIEKAKSNDTKSDLHYVSFKNIIKNDTVGKNDLILEAGTNLQFESSYNKTTIIDEVDNKNNTIPREEPETSTISNTIPIRGDYEKPESSTAKNIIITTRKNIVLTKPPSTRNSSDISILSNNIETETFKAINPVTTEQSKINQLSTSKRPNEITHRGSVKFSDYARISSTEPSLIDNVIDKKAEQIQQENQLVLVHVKPPNVENSTEKMAITERIAATAASVTTTRIAVTAASVTTTTETSTKFDLETTSKGIEDEITTKTFEIETTVTAQPELTTIEATENTSIFTTVSYFSETSQNRTETVVTTETSTVPTTLSPKTSIEDKTTPSFPRTSKEFMFTETVPTTQTELPTTSEVVTTEISTTFLPTTEIETTEIATTELLSTEISTIGRTSLRSITTTTSEAPNVLLTSTLHEDLSTVEVTSTENVESSTIPEVNFRNINVTSNTVKETEIDTTDSSEATSDSLGVNPGADDSGNNKGTIAAIVISCVAAVCLVLLAGLLVNKLIFFEFFFLL